MKKLNLENGTEIYFETSQNNNAFETQTPGQNVSTALSRVTHVGGEIIREAIEDIKNSLGDFKPDELEIEIGLTIATEGSIIITKGSAEANIKIKAVWKK